ncbi:hypothetical protein EGJ89_00430 [Stenotrophomonas maltophilia]|nr:hypothetical protein EGJ89_00430 [Stenotrophomonas maltophilia]
MSSMRNVLHRDLVSKAASLPRLPGVYTFHDEAGAALYIGKSVDIRRRVLDHLRAPDEHGLSAGPTGFPASVLPVTSGRSCWKRG